MAPFYTFFPVWSIFSQLVAFLLLLGAQRLLKRRLSKHFDMLNEFLCCCIWLWWSLETTLIGNSSWLAGNIALFIRLVAYSYIPQGASVSLCTALYLYWTGDRSRRNNIRRLCVSLLTALVAVPVTLLFCHYYWTLLGVTVSTDHSIFMEAKPSYFLTTTLLYGVIYELVPSFLMFLPSILNQSKSLLFVVCDTFVVLGLVYWAADYTGAFMNPMVALAFTVYWHTLSPLDYATHVIVFWAGPLIGTWAAAKLKLRYEDYQDKHYKLT